MNSGDSRPDATEDREEPWYRRAFQSVYLDLYAHRDEEDAARAVEFITSKVGLNPKTRLLDLCCGPGRHLGLLAPHVGSAVGLDLSKALLKKASESRHSRMELVEGDMRSLPFHDGAFDVVVNLFTSLGYFEDEKDNLRVLEEIARTLIPSGVLVIDHINEPHLRKSLKPVTDRKLENGVRVTEERSFDSARSRVEKRVRWIEPRGNFTEWCESVRVYRREEISELLANVGLEVTASYGGFDGSPLNAESHRMILLATRRVSGEPFTRSGSPGRKD